MVSKGQTSSLSPRPCLRDKCPSQRGFILFMIGGFDHRGLLWCANLGSHSPIKHSRHILFAIIKCCAWIHFNELLLKKNMPGIAKLFNYWLWNTPSRFAVNSRWCSKLLTGEMKSCSGRAPFARYSSLQYGLKIFVMNSISTDVLSVVQGRVKGAAGEEEEGLPSLGWLWRQNERGRFYIIETKISPYFSI